jgi:integrase
MYSVVKLEPGLQLERLNGRPTYRARAHYQGAVGYHSTGSTDLVDATDAARIWFAAWKRSLQPRTMSGAAKLHATAYSSRRLSAKADFLKRWNAISDIHGLGKMDPAKVDLKYLRAFVKARGAVSGNTTKKDMDTIRPILRTAHEEGWISALPLMPKATVEKNPRVPFTAKEWRQLREACVDQDVSDFMHVLVLGLLRPHEVLRLAARDIADDGERMTVHVRRKTGIHHAPVPMRFESLRAILRRRRDSLEPMETDLFPYSANWFPHAFGRLLDATGLRHPQGSSVRSRDSWSLRATGICLEIRRQRRMKGSADYLKIARWAGTSMSRIDGHYAAFLP